MAGAITNLALTTRVLPCRMRPSDDLRDHVEGANVDKEIVKSIVDEARGEERPGVAPVEKADRDAAGSGRQRIAESAAVIAGVDVGAAKRRWFGVS